MIWALTVLIVLACIGLMAVSAFIVKKAQSFKEETMKNWEEDL
jgi:flagellar basal body-associated protein FliL